LWRIVNGNANAIIVSRAILLVVFIECFLVHDAKVFERLLVHVEFDHIEFMLFVDLSLLPLFYNNPKLLAHFHLLFELLGLSLSLLFVKHQEILLEHFFLDVGLVLMVLPGPLLFQLHFLLIRLLVFFFETVHDFDSFFENIPLFLHDLLLVFFE